MAVVLLFAVFCLQNSGRPGPPAEARRVLQGSSGRSVVPNIGVVLNIGGSFASPARRRRWEWGLSIDLPHHFLHSFLRKVRDADPELLLLRTNFCSRSLKVIVGLPSRRFSRHAAAEVRPLSCLPRIEVIQRPPSGWMLSRLTHVT
eukprot:GHVU01069132.1.p2 GENE.GHVU01069132.1~~GHVU01069132.1.p2  ORF type:complete len:146 (-),score=5.59 GHVU01069132.1:494-931(-)